ncbi:AAA family ATPase [Nodularia sphaerocarpa]|uniref:AAA family ATPase n=1 Tax=Nodularia sphaerocarpa TaxID=137816 RepID=UPI001EFA3DC7|nr:AAA family ATPase [Nodularia sphaerocarpa]MDB9373256.1 AAA family ATPase [Nodularia sphaerocarpa CS-585]MDB9378905.1 AAA family ATPase [Nodularia sphaerocarpa CS-585A2]ULP73142.1 Sporulation initiation inhibitor protein Soj [Nodularia sphaerocarpa UHCC 0038]
MPFNPELCRNESEVESKLIVQYLLPQLGYTPDTWHQEVALGSIRLDFLAFAVQVIPLVLDANSPMSVVMEAKHPRQNLNNHFLRLRHYLTSLNVRYGLLTNGKEIRIYKKFQSDIQLVFQCYGKDVETEIGTIRGLIGRNSLLNIQFMGNSDNQTSENNLGFESKRKHSMKTIAIYHHKGGVGKTTVAVNLAAALSNQGKRVLLIDIDAQANTTFATGLIKFQFEEDDDLKERNIFHLLYAGGDNNFLIPDIVRKSNGFNETEIDVIPSHINLIAGEPKLAVFGPTKMRLAKRLELVKDIYDVVIIDTPPALNLYASTALTAADYLIIPSDLKPFSNQGLVSVKNFIQTEVNENKENMGKKPISIMGVLPSKISSNNQYLKYTFPRHRDVIPERYELPLMDNMITERSCLSHCFNQTILVGDLEIPDPKSIFEFAKNDSSANQSALEFESLAIEVIRKLEID